MTEQRKKILESVKFLKEKFPTKFNPKVALITEPNFRLPAYFEIKKKYKLLDIPPYIGVENGLNHNLLFARCNRKDVIIINGRFHFYDGLSMRDIGHFIYVLKFLGVQKIISIDEVANLNPRFKTGDLTLIYDQINLMGDNPLIGENDDELGVRFPDMSNAYDEKLFVEAYNIFVKNQLKVNESVYLGIIGPESETEAEARFYREIGADVVGYSLVPENIAAVHANMKFTGIGLITREIIADKMMEEDYSEEEREKIKKQNYNIAKPKIDLILSKLI
ncbi:MAG: purine-nucleoside phosphorylase [Ignavibacteria bacterium]|nr:purine-nucleoside phosphorylase [Ignavibacteria bacterium]